MTMDSGRAAASSETGSMATPEARSGLRPSGYDPARERETRIRAIEEVIGWIEETSFREVQGILARKKRDREDAALRGQTIRNERAELVSVIRARLGNESGTPMRALREIRDGTYENARGIGHYDLLDAALLAERKLITLTATLSWGGQSFNSTTADTEWRATITEKGLRVLAAIAIETEGQDRGTGLGAEHESAGRDSGIAQDHSA